METIDGVCTSCLNFTDINPETKLCVSCVRVGETKLESKGEVMGLNSVRYCVNSKCQCCGEYCQMHIDSEYCETCEKKRQQLLAAQESLPWQRLTDVPLDAWFRHNSKEGYYPFRRVVGVSTSNNWIDLGESRCFMEDLFKHYMWSMAPLDEASWKPCNMRYRNVDNK